MRFEFFQGLHLASHGLNQTQYCSIMEHQGGYMDCLRAWHRHSGYMTVEEISIVYDQEKIPERFFKAFQEFEMRKYNVQIVNHSQFRKE